jgi:hypothetical protein
MLDLNESCHVSAPIFNKAPMLIFILAVSLFREYLRIPTVHPRPSYNVAVEFLQHVRIYEF